MEAINLSNIGSKSDIIRRTFRLQNPSSMDGYQSQIPEGNRRQYEDSKKTYSQLFYSRFVSSLSLLLYLPVSIGTEFTHT